jgi:hypothetical protein
MLADQLTLPDGDREEKPQEREKSPKPACGEDIERHGESPEGAEVGEGPQLVTMKLRDRGWNPSETAANPEVTFDHLKSAGESVDPIVERVSGSSVDACARKKDV